MGHILIHQCLDCGYGDELYEGVGMMFYSLRNGISGVSKSRREKILSLLGRDDLSNVEFSHKIFVCPECNQQGSRFDFRLAYGDGKEYQPYFLCSNCWTRLIEDPDPYQSRPCPSCGSKKVIFNMGLWD